MVLPPGHLREFISRDSRLFRFPLFLFLLLHLPFSLLPSIAESPSLLRRPLVLFILHGIRRFPIRYQSFRENAGKRLRTEGLSLHVFSLRLSDVEKTDGNVSLLWPDLSQSSFSHGGRKVSLLLLKRAKPPWNPSNYRHVPPPSPFPLSIRSRSGTKGL